MVVDLLSAYRPAECNSSGLIPMAGFLPLAEPIGRAQCLEHHQQGQLDARPAGGLQFSQQRSASSARLTEVPSDVLRRNSPFRALPRMSDN
jgi:hypothetical protein